MGDTIEIVYSFLFDNKEVRRFPITLTADTLAFVPAGTAPALPWIRLTHRQCAICPLSETTTPDCPVARNLAGVVDAFKDSFSYENVEVTVSTNVRTYAKKTSLQEGLSALLGAVMVTSGCPVMEPLKPMVKFHLPFATLEETLYRMVSMYLVAQLLRRQQGKEPDWELSGLMKIYDAVSQVNRDFAERLKDAAKKDANVNALVNLDCFAMMIPMSLETMLEETRMYFSSYLR